MNSNGDIFPAKYKWLLWPVSMLYGAGLSIRNGLYNRGLLKPVSFSIPIISVGNLSVGGAGKTPHTEYLVRMLQDYLEVGTLSRGYKRKTKGFRIVSHRDNAEQVGDEPLQFKRKYPKTNVAVAESRVLAVPDMLAHNPETKVIILDDAYQHRAIQPGLNILLTEYGRPYTRDMLLPSGRLREWRSSSDRADVIIVSKCPPDLSEQKRDEMVKELAPLPHQRVFFTYYRYGYPYYIFNPKQRIRLSSEWEALLICAIARTDYLLDYLYEELEDVFPMEYEDHHYFNEFDMSQLKLNFEKMETKRKFILTTEKDAMRLELHAAYLREQKLPVFVLPLAVDFLFGEADDFEKLVQDFLLGFRA